MPKSKNLVKRNADFSVEIIENGFVLCLSGVDNEDNWIGTKLYCQSEDHLFQGISEFVTLPERE